MQTVCNLTSCMIAGNHLFPLVQHVLAHCTMGDVVVHLYLTWESSANSNDRVGVHDASVSACVSCVCGRRGALLAGVGFGLLHNSGGRNWAFAGWASAVGVLYGAAFVATQDILVPMGAHSLANMASGALWLQAQRDKPLE